MLLRYDGDMATYYDLLGVAPNSTPDEIRRSYIKLAFDLHPDRNNGDAAKTENFLKIKHAYEILIDTAKRCEYDSTIMVSNAAPWNDIFSTINPKANRRQPNYQRAGTDIEIEILISFSESYFGCTRDLSYLLTDLCPLCDGSKVNPDSPKVKCATCGGSGLKYDFIKKTVTPCFGCEGHGKILTTPCSLCSGTGCVPKTCEKSVSIPASIKDGSQIKYSGLGNPGLPPGDLLLKVRVSALTDVQRIGNDVMFSSLIPMMTMIEGGRVSIKTPFDTSVSLEVFPNSLAGSITAIAEKGFLDPKGGSSGDLKIRLIPDLPKNLTPAQISALRDIVGNK